MTRLDHQHLTPREPSVLALLRALVPARQLLPHEAYRIAEKQAARLLLHAEIDTHPIPETVVSILPRIRVVREHGLPMSGSAHWNGRHWIIMLSADEHPVRQRFSLMHEFKHVVDHTTREWLYRDSPTASAYHQAERIADYFAACVLMPRRIVKRLWADGHQNIAGLARMLHVSQPALRYRLQHLGITERPVRCDGPPSRRRHSPPTWMRDRYLRPAILLAGDRA